MLYHLINLPFTHINNCEDPARILPGDIIPNPMVPIFPPIPSPPHINLHPTPPLNIFICGPNVEPGDIWTLRGDIVPHPMMPIFPSINLPQTQTQTPPRVHIQNRETHGPCMVILFHTPWCPFSVKLAPHYNAFPRAFRNVAVYSIDVAEHKAFVQGCSRGNPNYYQGKEAKNCGN